MIVVTGSNGFIGSNLIKALNKEGFKDILAVDDHSNPDLKDNIAHCDIQEYIEIDQFLRDVQHNKIDVTNLKAIFHQGACLNIGKSILGIPFIFFNLFERSGAAKKSCPCPDPGHTQRRSPIWTGIDIN